MVLQGQFSMPSNLVKAEAGFHVLTLTLAVGFPAPGSNTALINYLSRQFRYVLVEVIVEVIDRPALLEFLRQEDLGYVFLRPSTDRIYQLEKLWQELEPKSRHCKLALKPILCLADGEEMNACDRVIQRVTGPVHMFVHGCPSAIALEPTPQSSEAFNKDLRRVAREIGGKLVGLALSSGAAKGFAHLGVIQVLEENGIEVDVVAGSSIGAYIGALWAYGCDGKELERLAREFEERWSLLSVIDPVF